ncbi:MAG: NADH-quinone oxidoreductase subunit NuoK [bacterium JZ-2024 1]
MIPTTEHYLTVGVILFCIGVYGFLTRRHLITILMCMELMLNGINLLLAAFNKNWGTAITRLAFGTRLEVQSPEGQIFAIFTITIGVAEAAIALALILMLYRYFRSVNVDEFEVLKW